MFRVWIKSTKFGNWNHFSQVFSEEECIFVKKQAEEYDKRNGCKRRTYRVEKEIEV